MSALNSGFDQRHAKRIKLMQYLFAIVFDSNLKKIPDQKLIKNIQYQLPDDETVWQEVDLIFESLSSLDQKIKQHAPERPLSEINQVDLAILRIIVWEADHKKTPKKVLIDEAVELAKEFGSESSPRFVNGVLGKLFLNDLSADKPLNQQ